MNQVEIVIFENGGSQKALLNGLLRPLPGIIERNCYPRDIRTVPHENRPGPLRDVFNKADIRVAGPSAVERKMIQLFYGFCRSNVLHVAPLGTN